MLSCCIGILEVGCNLAFVVASKQVIDIATGAKTGSFWGMGALAVAMLLSQQLFNSIDTWFNSCLPIEGSNRLRRRLFGHLLRVHWLSLQRFHSGDLINRVSKDVDEVTQFLTLSIPDLFITLLQFLASFVYFCFLDASLAWSLVFIIPLFLLLSKSYVRKMHRYNRSIRESDGQIQSMIQESVQHQVVIKTLAHKDRHTQRLDQLQDHLHQQVKKRTRVSLFSRLLLTVGFNTGYLVVFLWGAFRLSKGQISFGTMTAFLQLVGRIQRPAYDLTAFLPRMIKAYTAAERLMEIEALATENDDQQQLLSGGVDLHLENVSFAYDNAEEQLLQQVNMHFPAGSKTALIGKTGAGKTTLIRLMLALMSPQKGSIYLQNASKQIPVTPQTRINFVYVPQGNTLFSGTLRENLLMADPTATEAQLHEALHLSVADFVYTLKDGLDTYISEKGGGLSEGQAQRIAIARALLRQGNILLFDEVTSALDAVTAQQLLERLQLYAQHKTIIFITHHESIAAWCDQTYKIK
jgi:ABC-type multidrug transport system fused ATPase/permease subunit